LTRCVDALDLLSVAGQGKAPFCHICGKKKQRGAGAGGGAFPESISSAPDRVVSTARVAESPRSAFLAIVVLGLLPSPRFLHLLFLCWFTHIDTP